ncbi:hypothetical protein, unlikely [Trypanosoma brucei gambiense DAL972]|uniref:Uncharacterized protein n=1 Tax=Trypanosoma brucei gambiense (strain MHOM/CI/86/DAL972) TaxID=679716 RepID=C9ZUB3_TRYB9|nr:hypothetical protein, unlikely [Trypanosoma brucei gambiense DAL972]CBH13000.1 hypothetical protein, unlikely [Trypanosoma brucei gambiense DAL972]|eukprot:XP_011775278.1 hypothetical protein, unlikely [Trypanosoma brucei gambiense DAL972]
MISIGSSQAVICIILPFTHLLAFATKTAVSLLHSIVTASRHHSNNQHLTVQLRLLPFRTSSCMWRRMNTSPLTTTEQQRQHTCTRLCLTHVRSPPHHISTKLCIQVCIRACGKTYRPGGQGGGELQYCVILRYENMELADH